MKNRTKFMSRVGGMTKKRIERIESFIVGMGSAVLEVIGDYGVEITQSELDKCHRSTAMGAYEMGVSKSTAYRDFAWMIENGYMKISHRKSWRTNSSKVYYAFTPNALALATELMEIAE